MPYRSTSFLIIFSSFVVIGLSQPHDYYRTRESWLDQVRLRSGKVKEVDIIIEAKNDKGKIETKSLRTEKYDTSGNLIEVLIRLGDSDRYDYLYEYDPNNHRISEKYNSSFSSHERKISYAYFFKDVKLDHVIASDSTRMDYLYDGSGWLAGQICSDARCKSAKAKIEFFDRIFGGNDILIGQKSGVFESYAYDDNKNMILKVVKIFSPLADSIVLQDDHEEFFVYDRKDRMSSKLSVRLFLSGNIETKKTDYFYDRKNNIVGVKDDYWEVHSTYNRKGNRILDQIKKYKGYGNKEQNFKIKYEYKYW